MHYTGTIWRPPYEASSLLLGVTAGCTSISGSGNGVRGAKATAEVCNRLKPKLIGANMLTVYANSELYQEI